ncbi:MAG: hypothetical protein CMF59_08645 [Leptospiraceae bacterium]|nr:hypothetical protein [Leptospiraceae bacterium]
MHVPLSTATGISFGAYAVVVTRLDSCKPDLIRSNTVAFLLSFVSKAATSRVEVFERVRI